ncbi:MAG: hypothetical protein ACRCY4_03995 [Brevinema sp.]
MKAYTLKISLIALLFVLGACNLSVGRLDATGLGISDIENGDKTENGSGTEDGDKTENGGGTEDSDKTENGSGTEEGDKTENGSGTEDGDKTENGSGTEEGDKTENGSGTGNEDVPADKLSTTALTNIDFGIGFTNIVVYSTNRNSSGNIVNTDRIVSNITQPITILSSTNMNTQTVPPRVLITNTFFLGDPVFDTIRTNFNVLLDGSNPDFPVLAAVQNLRASLDTNTYSRTGAYEVRLQWNSVGDSTNFAVFRANNGTMIHLTNVRQLVPGNVDVPVELTSSIPGLGAHTYAVVATNFNQSRIGATNATSFSNLIPLPPSFTSVSTNLAVLVTNVTPVNEELYVYWLASNYHTNSRLVGYTHQRWSITYANKGDIKGTIRKGNSAENYTRYEIYRTSNPNSPNDLNGSDPNNWVNVSKMTLPLNGSSAASAEFTDNISNTTTLIARKGSGTPTVYPKFYYKAIAVNVVNGVEYKSPPSAISPGGAAINPDDLWSAPAYLNVAFDYNNSASDGFGGFAPIIINSNQIETNNYNSLLAATPRGLSDFGLRTRGGMANVGPKYPFWVAWAQPTFRGAVPYQLAKFWVRMGVSTSTNVRPNVPSFIKDTAYDFDFSFQANPDTKSTFQTATRGNPTVQHIVEMGHDTDNSRFPIIRTYRNQMGTTSQDTSRAKRPVGIGFIVTTINTAGITDPKGQPLEGESIGIWYGQNKY